MAGIYIHIPFCRRACHYCDFHFSTQLKYRQDFVQALIREMELRKLEWQEYSFKTLYFGGGTPSLLQTGELESILMALNDHYSMNIEEFSFEMNPDDVEKEYLKDLKSLGVNRISLGVQSFDDEVLKFMNRSHTSQQSFESIQMIDDVFENYSVDVIYGNRDRNKSLFLKDLDSVLQYRTPHISAYSLTIEPGTYFGHLSKKGKLHLEEEWFVQQYHLLHIHLQSAGFDHYEISNYAKDGYQAVHNTSYWQSKPYLAFGPSAHGAKNDLRYWNVSNNQVYIRSMLEGTLSQEEEKLSIDSRFNEYVMVGLRTKWGVDLQEIQKRFGPNYQEQIEKVQSTQSEYMLRNGNIVMILPEHWPVADSIIEQCFMG